jgi:hypothetical protein
MVGRKWREQTGRTKDVAAPTRAKGSGGRYRPDTPSQDLIDQLHAAMAPSDYAIQALLTGLDEVASSMERKWGVGRLPLLVGDLMRAKWSAQTDKLNAAIGRGLEVEIKELVEGTKRGWAALDRAATEAGCRPRPVDEWEFALPSTGEVCVLVRDAADVGRIEADGRMVWSLEEVGTLIDRLPDQVKAVKAAFSAGKVARIRDKSEIDWEKGDEIPF